MKVHIPECNLHELHFRVAELLLFDLDRLQGRVDFLQRFVKTT